MAKRQLFRLIIPAHPHKNVFSAVASRMTSLGPILVATAVNKSFIDMDVEVIDENNYQGPKDKNNLPNHIALQNKRPAKYVGFYCSLTSTMPRVYELASFYKMENVITITGGDHTSRLTEEALQNNIDIVVRGEGEEAIIQIIKALREEASLETIAGVSYKKGNGFIHNSPEKIEIGDLDFPPRPDFGLLRYAKKLAFYPISRTRGCSRRCEFCTVRSRPRWSSPEKLLEEIHWLVETRRAKYFFITDDRLNEDSAGTARLFESIIKAKQNGELPKNLSFHIQIRLEAARDIELLKLMKKAGVTMVCIGYESPIAAELNAMRKGIKVQDMVEYTRIFEREGFWVHAMFIFGYPAQSGTVINSTALERAFEFKKFIKLAKPDTIQVLLATPIPGTELYDRLNKQNRIYPRDIVGWENYDGGHLVFEPDDPMTAIEVQKQAIKIMHWFYTSWNFWKIPLVIFAFPFVVPFSWSSWRRIWRNSLWGYAGHRIIRQWEKINSQSGWTRRLALAQKKLSAIKAKN